MPESRLFPVDFNPLELVLEEDGDVVHPVFEFNAANDRLIDHVVVLFKTTHQFVPHLAVKVEHLRLIGVVVPL